MDFGLFLLKDGYLDLKKHLLTKLIQREYSIEDLIKIGTKAVQSSLYDLEQEGFITREIQNGQPHYKFNRTNLFFKIQKELEEIYENLIERKKYLSINTLFLCESCQNKLNYTQAIEKDFQCCGIMMKSLDTKEILQNIMKYMAIVENKLESLGKI